MILQTMRQIIMSAIISTKQNTGAEKSEHKNLGNNIKFHYDKKMGVENSRSDF